MQCFRWHAQLGLFPLVVCLLLGTSPTRGQSTPAAPPESCQSDEKKLVGKNLMLGCTSIIVARQVCSEKWKPKCTYDLIATLGNMDPTARCNPGDPLATKALILRQQIAERVMTASLQVDGFLAEVDSETGKIRAVHDALTDRQSGAVARSTLGSAVGTGGGAVGSALAIVGNSAATAGNWVGATFGGVGTFFGFLGYFQGGHSPMGCFPDVSDPKQCSRPKYLCTPDEPPSGCSPAMLHNLIFPDTQTVGYHSEYDLGIAAYLAGTPPGAKKSWRESLVLSWPKEGAKKKDKDCDPADAACYTQKVQALQNNKALFADNKNPRKVTISDLTERANKLADLRSVVARMNRDLSRLTEDLATELECPLPDGPNTE